jgi:hypothetical protein
VPQREPWSEDDSNVGGIDGEEHPP